MKQFQFYFKLFFILFEGTRKSCCRNFLQIIGTWNYYKVEDRNLPRIIKRSVLLKVPIYYYYRFHGIQGFNDWWKKKQKVPSLEQNTFKIHSTALWKLCSQSFASKWSFLKDIEGLAELLDSYAEFLQESNETQLENQLLEHAVQQLKYHVTIQYIPATSFVQEQYLILDKAVVEKDIHVPFFFSPSIHLSNEFPEQKVP